MQQINVKGCVKYMDVSKDYETEYAEIMQQKSKEKAEKERRQEMYEKCQLQGISCNYGICSECQLRSVE